MSVVWKPGSPDLTTAVVKSCHTSDSSSDSAMCWQVEGVTGTMTASCAGPPPRPTPWPPSPAPSSRSWTVHVTPGQLSSTVAARGSGTPPPTTRSVWWTLTSTLTEAWSPSLWPTPTSVSPSSVSSFSSFACTSFAHLGQQNTEFTIYRLVKLYCLSQYF